MRSDSQVCAAAAYIARNPVEARLCTRPEHWRWSSYRAAIENAGPSWLAVDDLLSFFGNDTEAARKRYAEMTLPHADVSPLG